MIGLDKEWLGLISVVLTFVAYFPDLWLQIRKKINLHMFSWIIWGLANGVAFLGQRSDDAGAGSWAAGTMSLLCFIIVGLSCSRAEKNITKSDGLALVISAFIFPVWYLTSDPLGAVLLATAIDVIGTYPTARKSFAKPFSESLTAWSLSAFRAFVTLLALENYTVVTITYPVAALIQNTGITCFLLWRRAKLGLLCERETEP
jgi:hypothetical protein